MVQGSKADENSRCAAGFPPDRSDSGEGSAVQVKRGNSGIGAKNSDAGSRLRSATMRRSGRPKNVVLGQAPGAIKRKTRLAMRVRHQK